jgi:uncharacterized protein YndB with AHSA1/START domain
MDDAPTREIEVTRVVDAPRDLVFAAFTEADHLAKWWGPEGFGVSAATSDPRPGGAFRIVMRGPDGTDHPVDGTYREIDAPRRLVTESIAVGPSGERLLEAVTTVELAEHGDKTEITVRSRAVGFVPEAEAMLGGMEIGWVQSLRCLEDHVTDALDRQIVIMRMVEAPREQVFDVWITPEHVANWWGPDGFTITTESMDVRPGGEWRFTMHGPDGTDYPNLIRYSEVVPPAHLAYAHIDMPAAEDTTFHVDVYLDEFLGNTVLSMKMVFPTAESLAENVARYHSIEGGNQTADRLVAYVLKTRHDATVS